MQQLYCFRCSLYLKVMLYTHVHQVRYALHRMGALDIVMIMVFVTPRRTRHVLETHVLLFVGMVWTNVRMIVIAIQIAVEMNTKLALVETVGHKHERAMGVHGDYGVLARTKVLALLVQHNLVRVPMEHLELRHAGAIASGENVNAILNAIQEIPGVVLWMDVRELNLVNQTINGALVLLRDTINALMVHVLLFVDLGQMGALTMVIVRNTHVLPMVDIVRLSQPMENALYLLVGRVHMDIVV